MTPMNCLRRAAIMVPLLLFVINPGWSSTAIGEIVDARADSENERLRKNVASHLDKFRGVHVEVIPPRVVLDSNYDVRVSAQLPKSLRGDFDLTDLEPDRLRILGPAPDFVKLQVPVKLGLSAADFQWGVIQQKKDYYLVWLYHGVAREKGTFRITATVGQSVGTTSVRVFEDWATSLGDALKELFEKTLPILLVATGTLLIVVSEPSFLFLVAVAWMILWTRCVNSVEWLTVIDTFAVVLFLCAAKTRKSILQLVVAFLARPPHMDSIAPDDLHESIERLRERAERITIGTLHRARIHLVVGIAAAVIGFIILLIPIHRLAVDHISTASSPMQLIVDGLPYVLAFACLMFGARFFLAEYRHSLEDHRHFEEKLREREWKRLVVTSGEAGARLNEMKDLLSMSESE